MNTKAASPQPVSRAATFFSVGLLAACIAAMSVGCVTENVIQLQAKPKDAGKAVDSDLDAGDATSATADASVDKAAACASSFGTGLTKAFGRLDGTVLAVVQPKDQQCPLPNSDHVILQVMVAGDVYRMVINIQSDFGTDPRVRYAQVGHALVGSAWSEGWHAPASLDYVGDLGVHADVDGFTPYALPDLAAKIAADIDIGDKVSVYADSSGGASAHKIHRNLGGDDGAIVLHAASSAPKFMLFHFDTQDF